jgi:transposase
MNLPIRIGMESFGHEVKLIPPQYVTAYVKRGKNDAADAEALCEAVTRPSMRFVPVKSVMRCAHKVSLSNCCMTPLRQNRTSRQSQVSV